MTVSVILTKVRIGVLVFLRQILNQIQNDGQCHSDATVILTKVRICILVFLRQILNQV
jgi:hypothetical protein